MQKTNKRKTAALPARAAEWLSLPESAFPGIPYLELHGDSAAAVAGYEALLSYDSEKICLKMQKRFSGVGTLCIEGRNLRLSALRRGCLSVRGEIDKISFVRSETEAGK